MAADGGHAGKPQAQGPTRIAVLSSAGGGGGGIAAKRMAEALGARAGVEADFLSGAELGGFLPPEVAPMKSMSNRRLTDTHYTLEYPGYRRDWLVDLLAGYDLVNVHWASYLVALAEFEALAARGVPLLFMLHDFHYITGGCHYPAGCSGLRRGCLLCPQIDETLCNPNFVRLNLGIKRRLFARETVHLAAPSAFLRGEAVASGIVPEHRAHVLRNPYLPPPVATARAAGGPTRIALVADSLTERRKSMPLAIDSLAALAARPGAPAFSVEVIGRTDAALKTRFAKSGLPATLHGRIGDHATLSGLLGACDMVLTCSTEDNWPNILVEAGVHGVVPVVGPGHGCEEFVRHYGIGRVAEDYNTDAFADAMADAIAVYPDPGIAAQYAGQVRAEHAPDHVAETFLATVASMGVAHV